MEKHPYFYAYVLQIQAQIICRRNEMVQYAP